MQILYRKMAIKFQNPQIAKEFPPIRQITAGSIQ